MNRSPEPVAITVADEVAAALERQQPVVALESTIIAHGLPRPTNVEVGRQLEQQLRAAGVTPATIAVLDGAVHVGLTDEQLERIGNDDAVTKASVRDLPIVVAKRMHAATTVAATAYLADRAGIRVFATGGLGGVHRQAADTFDESADLVMLAHVPIVVVCAGVKSILDVPATLERLETLGVSVAGFGTSRFPGFYVTDSGCELDWQLDDAVQAAAARGAADRLGLRAALVVANPIDEVRQLDPKLHDQVLAEALQAASAHGVRGKDVTPFLLDFIQRATDGASLQANIDAVVGNVAVAADIAIAGSLRDWGSSG